MLVSSIPNPIILLINSAFSYPYFAAALITFIVLGIIGLVIRIKVYNYFLKKYPNEIELPFKNKIINFILMNFSKNYFSSNFNWKFVKGNYPNDNYIKKMLKYSTIAYVLALISFLLSAKIFMSLLY